MTHTDPTTRRVPSWKTKRSSRRRRRGREEDRVVNICVNAERDASFVPTIEPVRCPASKEEEEGRKAGGNGARIAVETFGRWKAKRAG